MGKPGTTRETVANWDRALAAVRDYLRAQGLCEVCPPVRMAEVALEPFIEPLAAGDELLITSPELWLKDLVANGAGDIFAVAQCHRAGERGPLHAPAFHLVEWYRAGEEPSRAHGDVEALVAAVFEAAGRQPASWQTFCFLDLVEDLAGVRLRGDESAAELREVCTPDARLHVSPATRALAADPPADQLFAWTSFATSFGDACLDPFVTDAGGGVHVTGFPLPLAALSRAAEPGESGAGREPDGAVAMRFESFVNGVELANGYVELRDPAVQRARFDAVARMRAALGERELPSPERFLAVLSQPGLPPCTGVALGLERLVMLAHQATSIEQVTP